MMNKLYKIALCFTLSLPFIACNDPEEKQVAFSLNKSEITFAAEGGKDVVLVESNDSWTVSVSDPWLYVSPASGTGTVACNIVVDSSLVDEMRTAAIRFTPQSMPATFVTVRQMGYSKMIVPEEPEINIESSASFEERYFETTVTTNVKFNVEIDYLNGEQEWLSTKDVDVELDMGARPRTTKLRFDWKMNTVPEERVAEVKLIPEGDETAIEPAVITVRQKPAIKIEDNRAGDSIALVVIYERLNCWNDSWDTSDNMQHWSGVTLWEAADEEIVKGEVPKEAIGRVRAVQYSFLNTKETIPTEIRHLKYLESLSISSNVNTMLLNIELGSEICELEYLKYLTLFSYGIVSLPDDFVKLGKSLVALDLSANNFTEIPAMLTQENFPKLKSLSFVASRRWNTIDLRKKGDYEDGIGLNINATTDNAFRRLFLWENLEELAFSNCYIEGNIPDFTVGEEGVVAYTQKDVDAWGGDTIQYLADKAMPKILPNCTMLRLNLNFLTGNMPDWLLYHPHFMDWAPDLLIFNQQEKGLNSAGEPVRFDNEPTTFDYYYDVFPGTREKYELKDEITEE
ncbi:MAG: BACON domain-containing protein [Bacteroidaceae bacterium]|nr:BACON domain-containing protein [Bacteroidaceae bacterium]